MKVSKPKPFYELMQIGIKPEYFRHKAIDEKGRYLHWDEIKRRHPKDAEDVWLAIKMSRAMQRSSLKIGNIEFFYSVPNSLQAVLHFIDKMTAGTVGTSNFEGLTQADQSRFLLRSLVAEEAITSAQLEGAATTRKVAKAMLASERKPKTKDEMMILNNFHLMKEAISLKDEPLSIEMILELHRIATYQAIENNAVSGQFRQDNETYITDYNGETVHQPPLYQNLPSLMQDFCDFANTNHNGEQAIFIHPVIKAIMLHFLIGYIHPFGDGNGRTARALFYWFMLKSGYWLFEYISISRLLKQAPVKYARSYLYVETDEMDVTYFLYYQTEIIKRAINDLEKYINDKQNKFIAFSSAIANYIVNPKHKLNDRQIRILQQAVKENGAIFTAKEISNKFDIAENTARADLNGLYKLKLLGQIRNGKAISYIAPNDLLVRLRG
ncbi:Fic family protein [Gallibacterium anatis]|uniref:Fic family protein n=1 Tax=Gallibacterium anatis TaxID=750 RepID=UPI0039FCC126